MRLQARLGLAVFSYIAIGAPTPAWACAACACGDPVAAQIGLPDASTAGVVAGVSARAQRNASGRETQADYEVSTVFLWTNSPVSRLMVRIPWIRREAIEERETGQGMGDLEVTGILDLWKSPGLSSGSTLSVQLALSLPTGRRISTLGEDLQPGSGSVSGTAGISWFAHRGAWRAYASQLYRLNSERPGKYRVGNAGLSNAGVQRPVFGSWLDASVELNARYADRDRWPSGTAVPDTGGTVVYLSPGVLVDPGSGGRWILRGSMQIPIAQRTFGYQRPGAVTNIGLFYTF